MRFVEPDTLDRRPDPQDEARSLVTLDGTAASVDGRWLEAAVACEAKDPVAGWLLFLTADVPHEETLSIALLDPAGRTLDTAWLGGLYATGSWADPAIEGPGRLRFRFIDDKVWHLRLLATPELRVPFSEPRGSHRPLGLTRHFALSSEARQ